MRRNRSIMLQLAATFLLLCWNGGEQSPGGTKEGTAPAVAERPLRIRFPKLACPPAHPATMPKLTLPVSECVMFEGTLTLNEAFDNGGGGFALVKLIHERPGHGPVICQTGGMILRQAKDGSFPINVGFKRIPKPNRGRSPMYLQVLHVHSSHRENPLRMSRFGRVVKISRADIPSPTRRSRPRFAISADR